MQAGLSHEEKAIKEEEALDRAGEPSGVDGLHERMRALEALVAKLVTEKDAASK